MGTTTQNFENHPVFPKGLVYIGVAGLVAAIAAALGAFVFSGTLGTYLLGAAVVVNGFATVGAILVSRLYAVGLQDRIIRMEMRYRPRAATLTTKQLVGLRFASDAELPDLINKVLDEKLDKPNPIKKLVKDWQPDFERI